MFNFLKKSKIDKEKLEVFKCSSNFCETCEEMIFCDLEKCDSCGHKNICSYCKNDNELCKKCDDETEEFFNRLEKSIKKHEKVEWGTLSDLP